MFIYLKIIFALYSQTLVKRAIATYFRDSSDRYITALPALGEVPPKGTTEYAVPQLPTDSSRVGRYFAELPTVAPAVTVRVQGSLFVNHLKGKFRRDQKSKHLSGL